MENIRIYEEDGYIHFIMRPEDLMRLRYSTEAKTPFADFMDRWLTQMKTQVRENTMDGYRYAFEKHIKPFFTARGTTLATARPMDFQDFVNLKFDQGLSPTSIVKFHSIMHKCLKYAVALQIIPTNPSDNVMLPKRTRFRGQVYDRTQINIFLAAALQSPAEAAFVLAATYGLRRSECAGLRWCAVDFRARSMVINHTAVLSSGRVIYADSVKTKSSYRTLPLSDSLRRYLTDLRRRQNANRKKYGKAYCQSDYVCCREDGSPLRPDYISREFERVCRRACLPRIRFHDLRHPYVKHTTKKYYLQKQKSQVTISDNLRFLLLLIIRLTINDLEHNLYKTHYPHHCEGQFSAHNQGIYQNQASEYHRLVQLVRNQRLIHYFYQAHHNRGHLYRTRFRLHLEEELTQKD